MGACGGVFSSKCCCLAPLIKSVRVLEEEREGLERRELTKDVEDEDEEVKCGEPEEMEAAAATAATLFNCRRE